MYAYKHSILNELKRKLARVNHLDMSLDKVAEQVFLQRIQGLDV
jgi:hypothetical protein